MLDALDALEGNNTRSWLAGVSAAARENDAALDALSDYLRRPGGLTVFAIRDEPVLEAPRGNPRFEALLD